MPLVLWISRLCEEFGALPSQILREVAMAPSGLLEEIIETRAYIQAYVSVQAKDRPKGWEPPTPAMEVLVRQIEADLAKEERDATHGRNHG